MPPPPGENPAADPDHEPNDSPSHDAAKRAREVDSMRAQLQAAMENERRMSPSRAVRAPSPVYLPGYPWLPPPFMPDGINGPSGYVYSGGPVPFGPGAVQSQGFPVGAGMPNPAAVPGGWQEYYRRIGLVPANGVGQVPIAQEFVGNAGVAGHIPTVVEPEPESALVSAPAPATTLKPYSGVAPRIDSGLKRASISNGSAKQPPKPVRTIAEPAAPASQAYGHVPTPVNNGMQQLAIPPCEPAAPATKQARTRRSTWSSSTPADANPPGWNSSTVVEKKRVPSLASAAGSRSRGRTASESGAANPAERETPSQVPADPNAAQGAGTPLAVGTPGPGGTPVTFSIPPNTSVTISFAPVAGVPAASPPAAKSKRKGT